MKQIGFAYLYYKCGDILKPLLYNYYIDYTKKDKTRLIILCLLHELRVISVQQLIDFSKLNGYQQKAQFIST